MKLSIAVITMNRAGQLKEALESCLACALPEQTEFVIIDNASTDHTEETVHAVLKDCGYTYLYEKLSENLGVGGGRNYAFSKAAGEYVYMLDDDAVIDAGNYAAFFIKAVDILDQNPLIASLTTQIYDTAWQKNRVGEGGPILSKGLHKCFMFCGGSHFLRKSFYITEPYLPNKYGYEEIPPSLRAMNAGMVNAFCPKLLIIHKPANNKWDWNDKKNHSLLIKEIALPYAIKKMMYPKLVAPVLFLAYVRRRCKHLKSIPNASKEVRRFVREMIEQYPINCRIKIRTVIKMFRDFGLSAF